MGLKVLGVSASPVKKGNTETFLERTLQSVSNKGLQYDIVNLSRLKVQDCKHCNYCLTKQEAGRYCALKDDAQGIFDKAELADIIVLASPVYFMRTGARMAALIDRFRVFVFGNVAGGKLRNKIGVSMAVSWLRHGGMETTHLSHLYAFLGLEMIPASVHKGVSLLGASAFASAQGSGEFDPAVRLGIEDDELGLQSGRLIMRRAIELARLTKR